MHLQNHYLICALSLFAISLQAVEPHAKNGNLVPQKRAVITEKVTLPSTGKTIEVSCQKWNTLRAMEIKQEFDQANRKDLKELRDRFRKAFVEMNDTERKKIIGRIQEKIKNDINQLKEIKGSEPFEVQTIAFTSSISKLLGDGTLNSPGILNEALAHLKNWEKNPTILDTDPAKLRKTGHDDTVFKAILLYANLALKNEKLSDILSDTETQLIYAANVANPSQSLVAKNPSCKKFKDALGKTCLYCNDGEFKGCMMIPDAGYIYGAKKTKSLCRGTDCSLYVSDCIGSPTRHTTLSLQEIAQKLAKGIDNKEFTLLNPKDPVLEEGDVVVWRGKGIAHVVTFIKWKDQAKKEFIAIEAARQKNKEGIVIDQYQLFHRGITPSLLRPKENPL